MVAGRGKADGEISKRDSTLTKQIKRKTSFSLLCAGYVCDSELECALVERAEEMVVVVVLL